MENIFSRQHILILFAFSLVSLAWLKINWTTSNTQVDNGFSYEMPRPEVDPSRFDIADRSIDRQILTEAELAQKAALSQAEAAKNLAAANKAAAKKKAQGKTSSAKSKSSTLSVDIMGGEMTVKRNFSEVIPTAPPQQNSYVSNNTKTKAKTISDTPVKDEDEELKLSISQWRGLLMTQPNTQNASLFLKAHNLGYVNDKDFYELSYLLFTDSSEDRKKTGQWIIASDSGSNSFPEMSKQYGLVSEALRVELWKIMQSYSLPSRSSYLVQAMNSKQESVQTLSLQVLSSRVKEYQVIASANSQNGTQVRSLAGQAQTQSLSVFLPTLKKLALVSGSSFASTAQGLVVDIENLIKPPVATPAPSPTPPATPTGSNS
jgi:hypothetical protein